MSDAAAPKSPSTADLLSTLIDEIRGLREDLRRRSGETSVIHSRVIRTWGYGESALAETLADHVDALDESGHATIAFQASGIEGIKVRVTAKAENHDAAEAIIAAEVALIRERLGDYIFGYDDETMESVVLGMLRERGLTVAAGESLTGGILSTRITALDPTMEVFRGAIIAPVDGQDGEAGAIAAVGTDIGIAVIGPADPDAHPPGTVFAGVALPDGDHGKTVALPGVLSRMRSYAVITLLDLLRKRLA